MGVVLGLTLGIVSITAKQTATEINEFVANNIGQGGAVAVLA